MSHMGKAKLAIDTIRKLSSRILTRSSRKPVREANKHQLNSPSSHNVSRVSCHSGYSALMRSKFNSLQVFGKQNHRAQPFLNGARRFNHNQAQENLIPPGVKKILIKVLVGGGVVVAIWRLEKIPYSERSHVILVSKDFERNYGERTFKKVMKTYEGKVLPETHPKSVRVRSIAKEIIEALQRGLRYEQVGSDLEYSHDERLQVQDSSKKGQAKKGSKVATYHLEGLKWEIVVVNNPMVNAFCVPGGKIVVFTGLLDRFRTDAEIATVLAHEVGHVVARHGAERISHSMWFLIPLIILMQFVNINGDMSKVLDKALPFSRRNEKEADYIGLLLLASAGYDPRGAPQVYEKLGEVAGHTSLNDYLATHPSGKKTAKLLSQDKVMKEALSIYRESNSGRGIEGFL